MRAQREPALSTHGIGAEAHRRALVLDAALSGIRSMTGCLAFGSNSARVRASELAHVARELDDRELHAEADAEERHAVLARVADRVDLALDAAIAEAAGHEDRVDVREELLPSLSRSSRSSLSMYSSSTRTSFARPPWTSASCSDLYESRRWTYLPTTPIFTLPRPGFLKLLDDALPRRQIGLRATRC